MEGFVTERAELERHLLNDPFDAEARADYARLLLDVGEAEAAIAQFELLCRQQPQNAAGHIGAALALLRLGRPAEAISRYTQARGMDGFAAEDELDRLEGQARRAAPQLRVVATPERSNVVSIQQPPEERVRFSSIIGAEDLKRTIRLKIIEPFINPGLFQRFRKQAGGGILLYGPPGCGKTMIARAIANECEAEFISVGISDVLNMWIGESERNLASLFDAARSKAPCVLFFDEIDALAYSRSKARSEHTRTVVNEFLAQLDGMGRDNRAVLILAATNMPWDVDPAMKRPGRFSRQIFVPPPEAEARRVMLETKLTGVPQEGLNLAALAEKTANYSGADIDGLIELAKESALNDALLNKKERPLSQADFEQALAESVPSTLDWLRTARNIVKYAGDDRSYRDVEAYLKRARLL
jgi:SpoVK/Ycf46/Vps4 family AAA+-type ATPase